jgi:hypothetical protein
MQSRIAPVLLTALVALLQPSCTTGADEAGGGSPPASASNGAKIRISAAEAKQIGNQIWKNECGGTVAGLTSWNQGEYFASLGIGHFIWYHAKKRGPFEESFPPLVRFLIARGADVPKVARATACPWSSRGEFLAAQNSPAMRELRGFLHKTIPLQTEFILQRLERALPKMLASVPAAERAAVRGRFYAVAESAKGKYALMDYVNFKGEGTKASERYKGQGWGMLQVLQGMRGSPRGAAAAREYAASADRVLTRRVANAPKNESQWLPGWRNRLKTYRP